jgi:hypothetical protein
VIAVSTKQIYAMLERATDYRDNHEQGRFVLTTTHAGGDWEIIVEPEFDTQLLIVVTAYTVG